MTNELASRIYKSLKKIDCDFVLKTITFDDLYINKGEKFIAFYKATIPAGQTALISVVTPARYVHFTPASITPSADKVSYDVYKDATINVAGTLMVANNLNDNSLRTTGVQIRVGSTFSANGDLMPGLSIWLPGSTGVGQSVSGQQLENGKKIILKPSTTYRIVVANGSLSENIIGISTVWYETDEL